MVNNNANINTSASFKINPNHSQVVLTALIVTAIISLILGASLLAFDNLYGLIFVTIAILLLISTILCWTRSHHDTDLAQSHPTTLNVNDSVNLTTDSRVIGNRKSLDRLLKFIEAIATIKPLPSPSGLTGAGAVPIPNSTLEAENLAAEINKNIEQSKSQALSIFQSKFPDISTKQVTSNNPPPISEEDINGINLPIDPLPPSSPGG